MSFHVSALNIYPVKSFAGISLTDARLEATGLKYDRGWMAVKPDGTFLTQRTHPQLALVETGFVDGELTLSCFGMDSIAVPVSSASMVSMNTQIWGDNVRALDTGDATANWLQQAIGEPGRLLVFPASETRFCDPEVAQKNDHTRFADAFPLLILSEASLNDLNARLAQPVGMDRFRPNLVISGCDAFDEDNWQQIRIGDLNIRLLDRCARCSVPTVDQTIGELAGPEPIHTLTSYREQNGEVYFGRNAAPDGEGMIKLGDEVSVIS